MKQVVISTRIPAELAEKIDETIAGKYVNSADFVRDLIREAILQSETKRFKEEYMKDKDSVKLVRKFRRLCSQLYTDQELHEKFNREAEDFFKDKKPVQD